MIDTTAPVMKAVKLKDGLEVKPGMALMITISDNLSGIASYRGTLNGKWILMDYDAKNRLLTYEPDALLIPGENIFMVSVTDGTGNTTVMQWKVISPSPPVN